MFFRGVWFVRTVRVQERLFLRLILRLSVILGICFKTSCYRRQHTMYSKSMTDIVHYPLLVMPQWPGYAPRFMSLPFVMTGFYDHWT